MTETHVVTVKAPFEPERVYVTDEAGYPQPVRWSDGSELGNPFGWNQGRTVYFWAEPGKYKVHIGGKKEKRHEAEVEVQPLADYLREVKYTDGKPFWIRTYSRSDEYTIEENSYRALKIKPGEVVFDLGAHIGTFTRRALHAGAGAVYAYEAEPSNYVMLAKNLEGFEKAHAIHGAVTTGDAASLTLYVNTGKCSTINGLYATRGRVPVPVPAVDFHTELQKYRPSIVKSDMEGSEYFLNWQLPDFVKKVAMEVHTKPEKTFLEKGKALVEEINNQGFTLVKPIRVEAGARMAVGVWERA